MAYAAYEAPQHHKIARSVRSTAQRGREPAAEGIASLYEQTWVLVVVKIQTDDTEHVRTGSKPFYLNPTPHADCYAVKPG